MAGIGIELKRIFRKDSLVSVLSGAAYSTLVVIGPTVIVMAALLLMYGTLGYMNVNYAERELLSATILYVFIFALLVTAPVNAVMSRYIADKIFEETYEDILPSFCTGLALCEMGGAALGIPFAVHLVVVGNVEVLFVILSYLFFMELITVFYAMTYLTATKDYKITAMDFVAGMLVTILSALCAHKLLGFPILYAILGGLCLGFFLIAVLQTAYIRHYFAFSNRNYGGCLSYFVRMKRLFFGTLFYSLGIYVHNFVFWGARGHLVTAESYYCNQAYDMASCLGMFTNISAMVIFTVMAETSFHDMYQTYNEAVIGAALKDIEIAQKNMFHLLIRQMGYVIRVQAIISMILFLLVRIFLPDYGFSGLEMTIYPGLAAAYFCIFIMYCNIIYLYYFNDSTGTFLTGLIFLLGTLLGSLVTKGLQPQYYGLGALFGGLLGWTLSYFRIWYLERHIDHHIMCSMHLIKENKVCDKVAEK